MESKMTLIVDIWRGDAPQLAMQHLAAEATGLRVMHRIVVPHMLERLPGP